MKKNAYIEVDTLMKNRAYRFGICSHEGICLHKGRFSDWSTFSEICLCSSEAQCLYVLLALMRENAYIQVDSLMKIEAYFSENGLS